MVAFGLFSGMMDVEITFKTWNVQNMLSRSYVNEVSTLGAKSWTSPIQEIWSKKASKPSNNNIHIPT